MQLDFLINYHKDKLKLNKQQDNNIAFTTVSSIQKRYIHIVNIPYQNGITSQFANK